MSNLISIALPSAKRYENGFRNLRSFIAVLCLAGNLAGAAQGPPSREYQLKAVFLFNFSQFVEWPAASFSSDQAPFVIGILGKNPFGTYLEEIVSGEKVNGHIVNIQYYNTMDEIKACQILFIGAAEDKKVDRIVESLKGKNILTVSDASGFAEQGGMIRLFTRDNKIKFQINLEASKAANLVLSSKLLRLADIYIPSKNS